MSVNGYTDALMTEIWLALFGVIDEDITDNEMIEAQNKVIVILERERVKGKIK